MPTPIRSRLVLLMMTVLLPATAGALFVVARAYQSERVGLQRSLRENALAMAQVIDRELARRVDVMRTLATSPLLTRETADDADMAFLQAWFSRIAKELGGAITLHSASQVLIDTRLPTSNHQLPVANAGFEMSPVPLVVPQLMAPDGTVQPPRLVQPLRRISGELLNIVMTVPPEVLQRVIDHQRMLPNRVGTVVDNGQRVVARHPGGAAYIGRLATPDMRERLPIETEGAFSSVTLDGMPSQGHFSTTPQGWAYMTAVPRDTLIGDVPAAAIQAAAGALALLGLAIAAAQWVGRGIARAADSLNETALALQAGATVRALPTGIAEFDEVNRTLAGAAQALAMARQDMEHQVAAAVARTRQVEQRVSQGQRIAALGRLTGGVAHDFNNLLGVISNSAHLIERHAAQIPALQMPVDVTRRAVEMGSHLSQQLLRFGARQAVSPRPVDLASALPQLHEMLQMVARKNVQLSIVVEPGTAPVKIDPSELELALINLALNARDAMPTGGQLRLQARNAHADEAGGLPAGDYVLVSVSDNGVGIADEQAAHVFEPFFTSKGVGQGLGLGLGLSQVHGFCVQAGGTARISSTPGLGSTVTLLLPTWAGALTDAPAAGPSAAVQTSGGELHGVTLLLVEDNDELAEVTEILLHSYGCVVKRASHVDDALAKINHDDSLQLVLTDVVMPGSRNGVDLARELARNRPQLPVVIISGYSSALAGLTGFWVLRKPVSADLLVRTLVAALAGEAPPA